MDFLKIWLDFSQFAAADQQVDRSSHVLPEVSPRFSVAEDGEVSFLSTTFILPLTVGLSTLVASVLLTCRNRGCIDTKTSIQTITPHHHQSAPAYTPSSSSGKRKSVQGKQNVSLSGSPGYVFHQDLGQRDRAPVYKGATSPPTDTTIQRPPPSPVDDQSPISSLVPTPAVKKSKKRPTKSRQQPNTVTLFTSELILGSSTAGEVGERDESWVTVTPKRSFKTSSHQPNKQDKLHDEHSSPRKQFSLGESRMTKPIVSTNTSIKEAPLSVCTCLQSSTTSSCATSPSCPHDDTTGLQSKAADSQQVSQKLELNTAVTTTVSCEKIKLSNHQDEFVIPSPIPRLQVGLNPSATTSDFYQQPVKVAPQEPIESSRLTSSASALHSQHLSAQLQAKELECQVLREEVIHLRDEIKSVRVSSGTGTLAAASPQVEMRDVETMTFDTTPERDAAHVTTKTEDTHDVKTRPAPLPTATSHNLSPTTSATTQSPNSSEVLLATLQAEIRRLAKEVTLSHQRNENLEFRLSTATKQLSMATANTVPVASFEATKEDLISQVKLTQAAEARCAESEQRLTDMQHLLETKSGSVLQWENSCADLMKKLQEKENECASLLTRDKQLEQDNKCLLEDQGRLRQDYENLVVNHQQLQRNNTNLLETKDRLHQDYECLLAKHKVAETELRRVEELVTELRQNCLSTCERHLNTVEEHKRAMEELNRRVSESQDTVRQLNQEIHRLQELLASRQLELDELHNQLAVQSPGESLAMFDGQADIEHNDCEVIKSSKTTPPTPLVDAVVGQLTISQLTSAELEAADEGAGRPEKRGVEQQYHHALDSTEAMLSRLQASVDEEEQRWRKALDASIAECQLLTTKVDHLETSLVTVMEERDTLAKSLQQQQQNRHACNEAADGDSHSLVSTGAYSSVSLPRFALDSVPGTELSPDTPHDELLAYIGRLRHLVRIEHNALKREQSKSAHLEAELKTTFVSRSSPVNHRSGASLNGVTTVNSGLRSSLGLEATEEGNLPPTNGTSSPPLVPKRKESEMLETKKVCGDVVGENQHDVLDGLLPALSATSSDLHNTETAT